MPTIEQAKNWYPHDDAVHGFDHVMRVYWLAERLARQENADWEIVSAAVLLHDARGSASGEAEARAEHHEISATFAGQVLAQEGWPPDKIAAVQHCIRAHRFRSGEAPQTLEARVMFDADKLDAIGAIGAARSIAYAALDNKPFYAQPSEQFIQTFELEAGELHTSFHEFLYKLSRIPERMYTASGKQIAEARRQYLDGFYRQLGAEYRGEK